MAERTASGGARLEVSGLRLMAGDATLLDDVSFTLHERRILALVGSSGAGKTLIARALAGLVRPRPGVVAGRVRYLGPWGEHEPYRGLSPGDVRGLERGFQPLRGAVVVYVPQSATGALDPTRTVSRQLRAALDHSRGALDEAGALAAAGFLKPDEVGRLYPHELSGGMAQRVALALALAREPRFLLVDEPTTGLDPRARQVVLGTLAALRDRGVAVLLVTHDLRQIPGLVDEVLFVHRGRIVERCAGEALRATQSPEARALVEATGRIAGGAW